MTGAVIALDAIAIVLGTAGMVFALLTRRWAQKAATAVRGLAQPSPVISVPGKLTEAEAQQFRRRLQQEIARMHHTGTFPQPPTTRKEPS